MENHSQLMSQFLWLDFKLKSSENMTKKHMVYSRLSLNGHLYKTDTSVKRTPRVGPCLSLLPLFDFL